MAVHNQPQRSWNPLPCNVPLLLRRSRTVGSHHADTAVSSEQQCADRDPVQPVRNSAWPSDDILGSVPLRLWLRELHNSTTNWSSGPCIPKAQRDELLVLLVQRRCNYNEFHLRCPRPRLDALFSSNRVSIHSNNRTQRWGCRTHPDHGLNNNELGELSRDHVQGASSGHEVEEHAGFPVGDSGDDLHDALCVSVFPGSCSPVIC